MSGVNNWHTVNEKKKLAQSLRDGYFGPFTNYVRSSGGRGRGGERLGVKRKAYIYCFDDVILLFKSVQGGRGCLEITKFEHTYFMDENKSCYDANDLLLTLNLCKHCSDKTIVYIKFRASWTNKLLTNSAFD